jgi:hypothetical protein
MSESDIQQNSDDEISLIDLFVVLLKYRKLIIAVTVLGIIVSACFYVVQTRKNEQTVRTPELTEEYEGSMTVIINPRLGRSGTDGFPAWFDSKGLIADSVKDSGLAGGTASALAVVYKNNAAYISLKPVGGDKEQVEKLFSLLLENAEIAAAANYKRYAEDIISYAESGQPDVSTADYARCRWAKDFLAGSDTVLVALYPPVIENNGSSGQGRSPRMVSLVIIIASLFFAVFLAFVLNALKNVSGDGEAMAKIRGALGKDGDKG